MIVSEFIRLLQGQPQNLQVAYRCCSEQCLVEPDDIDVVECCKPREDGWIQDKRPDKETETYLLLPGN